MALHDDTPEKSFPKIKKSTASKTHSQPCADFPVTCFDCLRRRKLVSALSFMMDMKNSLADSR